jgi:hypothetical protein
VARHYTEKATQGQDKGTSFNRRKVPRSLWDEALEAVSGCDDKLDGLIARRLGGSPRMKGKNAGWPTLCAAGAFHGMKSKGR